MRNFVGRALENFPSPFSFTVLGEPTPVLRTSQGASPHCAQGLGTCRGWCPAFTSRLSAPPGCFLAFVQKQRVHLSALPVGISAAGLKAIRTGFSLPAGGGFLPHTRGQTVALLPPSGVALHCLPMPVPTLLSHQRFGRGRNRRSSLSLEGISEIDAGLCGLEGIRLQISYCS